ncbi:MAG: SMC-Scp complex subunit ScpB [Gemmatimonadota bacterium]
MKTTQIIEALLFASDAPLSAEDLSRGEEELDAEAVRTAIQALREEYEAQGRAFQVYEIGGGYQLLTRPEYSPHLERFETVPTSTRLSGAALEVMAIVAYRQPLTRAEVEEIRGVGSSHVLRSLQELGLIDVVGRGEGLGRPLLYGTTARFLDHFGFASLDDLPKPDELPVILAATRGGIEGDEAGEAGQVGAASAAIEQEAYEADEADRDGGDGESRE